MTTPTLLLIDIQNDFLPTGPLPVPHGDQIIPIINSLIPQFAHVIASQDWHPKNHASFASNHAGKKPSDIITLNAQAQILWPDHCIQNTPGADLAPALDTARISHITRKGQNPTIDSYSAFFDNGHLQTTDLHAYLQSRPVTHLHLAGLATDYCVKFTALDARQLGYQVTLIQDATRGVNLHPHDIENALHEMQQAGVQLIPSGTVASVAK